MGVRARAAVTAAAIGIVSLCSFLAPTAACAQTLDLEKEIDRATADIARTAGSARGLLLEMPAAPLAPSSPAAFTATGDSADDEPRSSGFFSSLNELLAPKEVLLDVTRLGSQDLRRNVVVLAGGLGLAVLATDDVDAVFVGARQPAFDDVSESMSFLGGRAFLYPALATSFFVGKAIDNEGISRTAAQMTQALLLTDLLVTPIKMAVGRTRPDGSNDRSFPSGHTAGAFALATVLQHNYGYKVGLPAYAFAGLVGAARVDERKHFVSDVIVGAAIGFVAASTVNNRFPGHRMDFYMIHPQGGGRGVGFRLEF